MIETIPGMPDNVVACAAKGHVTKADYEAAIIPAIERALKAHKKIRCYYELGRDFQDMSTGALWEDFVVGVEYLSRWERIAVVTDVEWIAKAVNAFRFLIPGPMRVFANAQAAEARAWIAES